MVYIIFLPLGNFLSKTFFLHCQEARDWRKPTHEAKTENNFLGRSKRLKKILQRPSKVKKKICSFIFEQVWFSFLALNCRLIFVCWRSSQKSFGWYLSTTWTNSKKKLATFPPIFCNATLVSVWLKSGFAFPKVGSSSFFIFIRLQIWFTRYF